jgi:glycosyltransferase involved in cell wall biosynthesis
MGRMRFDATKPARVTVIIPTCDRPAMLARALASVRVQELAPAEVIVVDDGDPRHCAAVAQAVLDSGVSNARAVTNARSKGASAARNTGARRARASLLAFLDDDDEWLPAYLDAAVRTLRSARADVVCTDLLYHYEDGTERAGKSAPDGLIVDAFLTRNPGLIGSNLLLRRTLFRALGGFDESLPTSEDIDFGIRLSLAATVRYAPLRQRLVRHHQHGSARLCTRRGDAMRIGVRRFFELHGARMSEAQRAHFRRSVRATWGIDEYGHDPVPAPASDA